MNTCLYCDAPADSLEHVIPAAFGEFVNAPNLDGRLCGDCNNRLGLLDQQLSRCGPEAILRKFYNVQGRHNSDPVNVFERGSAQGKRIEFTAWDEVENIEVNLEIVDGVTRQLCEIKFIERPSGKTHHLPIRKGMTAEHLRTSFAARNVLPPFDTHLSADAQEQEWIMPLLREVWPDATMGESTMMSTVYKGAVSKHVVTDRYFRAFAKIGFHYFLTQFQRYSGHELIFADIRKVISEDVNGAMSRIGEFVVQREGHLFREYLDSNAQPPQGVRLHFVDAGFAPGVCLAHVRLFVTGEWIAPTYTVRLSQNSASQDRGAAGHAYVYYPDGKEGTYSGEAAPLRIETAPMGSR